MSSGLVTRPPETPAPDAVRLRDFDELAAFFSGWDGRFEQLSTGRFEGSLRVAHAGLLRAVAVEFNQVILARGAAAPGQCTVYTVTPDNALGVWQGRRLEPGRLVVHGPGGSTDHRTARRGRARGLTVPAAVLLQAARVLRPTDGEPRLPAWEALLPPPEVAATLDRHIRRLLDLGGAAPADLNGPEFHRFEQECVRAVVAGVFPAGATRRSGLPLSARAVLIRRADEFMRTRLGTPVGAIDLCAELGTSDRTLRLAFRERFGVGPMAYFRALRLNAVRTVLKATPSASVAGVARDHGFQHLGNFAADYRRAFGELPSATRRRPGPTNPIRR